MASVLRSAPSIRTQSTGAPSMPSIAALFPVTRWMFVDGCLQALQVVEGAGDVLHRHVL